MILIVPKESLKYENNVMHTRLKSIHFLWILDLYSIIHENPCLEYLLYFTDDHILSFCNNS
jgi:hypothetical protein